LRCISARSCGAISARPTGSISRPSAPVNLVSRLEGLCRPLGKADLVSGAFAAETATPLIPLGEHALRGIASPCAVFTVPED
jgi:class 3 adenylate cyclase